MRDAAAIFHLSDEPVLAAMIMAISGVSLQAAHTFCKAGAQEMKEEDRTEKHADDSTNKHEEGDEGDEGDEEDEGHVKKQKRLEERYKVFLHYARLIVNLKKDNHNITGFELVKKKDEEEGTETSVESFSASSISSSLSSSYLVCPVCSGGYGDVHE